MISMRIFLLHFETNISLTLTLSRYAVMAWFLSVNESCPLTLVSICLECSRRFTIVHPVIPPIKPANPASRRNWPSRIPPNNKRPSRIPRQIMAHPASRQTPLGGLGTRQGTNRSKLYEELGWETFSQR